MIAYDSTLTLLPSSREEIHCCAQLFFCRYNINWNYGLLPQTWEDPTHSNPDIENTYGDNDPGNAFLMPRI
jgi:inorganic pyrophosphatase